MARSFRNDCFAQALSTLHNPGNKIGMKDCVKNDVLFRRRDYLSSERQQAAVKHFLRRAGLHDEPKQIFHITILDRLLGAAGSKPRRMLECISDAQTRVIGVYRALPHANALLPTGEQKGFCVVAGRDIVGNHINESWSLADVLWLFGSIEVYSLRVNKNV